MKLLLKVMTFMTILGCYSSVNAQECSAGYVKCNDGTEHSWDCQKPSGLFTTCEAMGYNSSSEAATLLCANHRGYSSLIPGNYKPCFA